MCLPTVELTEFTPEFRSILDLWWETESFAGYVGDLEKLLRDQDVGSRMATGRIARPTLRWIAHDLPTCEPVGYVSVQVTGQSGPNGSQSPVERPFHGGVCIAVDPHQQRSGIGSAMLTALLAQPLLDDVATLGGAVDATNAGSLGMLRKLGVTKYTTEVRAGKTFRHFTIPGPANR